MKEQLHIWHALITDAEPSLDQLISTLSDEEISRGQRFINPKHSRYFLLAHAILRNVLSRYIDQAPEKIIFKKTQYGKPFLADSDLQFNLSHSNERVLVAVSMHHRVGIDVEFMQTNHRFDDLVQRFFSVEEQQEYALYTSEEAKRLAFYRGWTRKEAYLKATGLGLSFPLDQFAVSLEQSEKHALLRVKDDTSVRTKWTVLSYDVDADYLASLAIEASINDFQTHIWSRT